MLVLVEQWVMRSLLSEMVRWWEWGLLELSIWLMPVLAQMAACYLSHLKGVLMAPDSEDYSGQQLFARQHNLRDI